MVTSKLGINFVKAIVESSGCLFHKIDQENDLGIDAIIELIDNGIPLNKQIGIQIKSGQSFYNGISNQCLIPVGKHFDYWLDYPLAVYGIVYVPSLKSSNWVNIKEYLKSSGQCMTIKFDRTKTNVFDNESFLKIFLPTILNKLPKLSFNEAAALFHSFHPSENHLGLLLLFRISPNMLQIWDWFIDYFKSKESSQIPPILIYYFAHIPGHPDIIYSGEKINKKTEAYVKTKFDEFDKKDVSKLLCFIDEENGISRGSIGQSVEAIISSLKNRDRLLLEIGNDRNLPLFSRECAAVIYAYHNRDAAIPMLKFLSDQGSWYAGELLSSLRKNKWIDPYA
jgi:hypothetical protein